MIAVVMAANLVSPIASLLWDVVLEGSSVASRLGDALESDDRMGRHLRTASTDALQGWTWRG